MNLSPLMVIVLTQFWATVSAKIPFTTTISSILQFTGRSLFEIYHILCHEQEVFDVFICTMLTRQAGTELIFEFAVMLPTHPYSTLTRPMGSNGETLRIKNMKFTRDYFILSPLNGKLQSYCNLLKLSPLIF